MYRMNERVGQVPVNDADTSISIPLDDESMTVSRLIRVGGVVARGSVATYLTPPPPNNTLPPLPNSAT